jgi:membrane-associated phospholipid phosphatase/phytoene/squalene synthetase
VFNRGSAEERSRLLAWPQWQDLRITGALALGLVGLWLLVYGGASWITGFHGVRLAVAMDWESHVPFVPEAAAVYLSLNLMVLVPLFVFRRWEEVVPLLVVMVAETVMAGICFLLLPVEGMAPRPEPPGVAGAMFRVADALNLDHNYLPSLHVSYALTVALAVGRRCSWPGKIVFTVWAVAIAISTVLTHQHYVVDIVGAVLLTAITMTWLYDAAATPTFIRTLRAESRCLCEIYWFSRRHLRYLTVAILIYWHSLFRWRRRRAIRVGFCLLQHVDDLLDGDRPSLREPSEIIDDVVSQLERRVFNDDALGCLARCLSDELAHFQGDHDDPRAELIILIRHMQRDRTRVKYGQLLTEDELRLHHRLTFHHAVNLMLILGEMQVRASDVPSLIEAFGWCSVMRDLRDDLEKGLVNIPASVVDAIRSKGNVTLDYDSIVRSPVVLGWLQQDHARAVEHLNQSESELARLRERSGVALLRLFQRSIWRIAVATARQYGWEQADSAQNSTDRYPASGQ